LVQLETAKNMPSEKKDKPLFCWVFREIHKHEPHSIGA